MHLRTAAGGALLVLGAACSPDNVGPSPDTPLAADSAGTVAAGPSPALSTTSYTGIVFGSFNMPTSYFNSVHDGAVRNLDPSYVLSNLSDARAKGARLVLKMCNGSDSYVKNSDGTFSFTKWKSLVDRYKTVSMGQYISDGTLMGHYLIDEPNNAKKWGGKVIPQSTVEAMAKYSKQIWPGLATLVRVVPSWLANSTTTYTYLDAGWAQYASGKGDPGSWIAGEVAAAKKKGLGLVVGLNVLSGGNGSSGISGWSSGTYAMSASEIKNYGGALLSQSYACGFFMWMYDSKYYGRSDMKSAMASLSYKADAHTRTSCRQ